MKKQFLVLLPLLLTTITVLAQKEYKLAKTSGHLVLNMPGAIIEGYAGNEIVFSVPKSENEVVDERAKGLRIINRSGFTDNTGIGLDVSEKGDEITVNSVSKDRGNLLTIKVPQNIKISFRNTSMIYQTVVTLKNLKNELDISTSYNTIKLENNTGPMNVKTLYGSVDAIFPSDIKGPVSIVSVYGHVDVSLPAAAKVNVELGTSYGKLYAAEGLKIALDKNAHEKQENEEASNKGTISTVTGAAINDIRINRDIENIKGKINGGGANLILKSTYQNVYLREK